MKIILLQDVPKIGKRHEAKDVASGYAANFLIPKKLAEIATDKKLKALEERKKQHEAEVAVQHELLEKNLEKLGGQTVTISAKANEQGHLFKGIHVEEIAAQINKKLSFNIEGEAIELLGAIKNTGEYPLTVKVGDKAANFVLTVVAL